MVEAVKDDRSADSVRPHSDAIQVEVEPPPL